MKKCQNSAVWLKFGLIELLLYDKGEGGAFPEIWVMASLMSPNLPVVMYKYNCA
jgi:hypothetical protein